MVSFRVQYIDAGLQLMGMSLKSNLWTPRHRGLGPCDVERPSRRITGILLILDHLATKDYHAITILLFIKSM